MITLKGMDFEGGSRALLYLLGIPISLKSNKILNWISFSISFGNPGDLCQMLLSLLLLCFLLAALMALISTSTNQPALPTWKTQKHLFAWMTNNWTRSNRSSYIAARRRVRRRRWWWRCWNPLTGCSCRLSYQTVVHSSARVPSVLGSHPPHGNSPPSLMNVSWVVVWVPPRGWKNNTHFLGKPVYTVKKKKTAAEILWSPPDWILLFFLNCILVRSLMRISGLYYMATRTCDVVLHGS